MNGNSDTPAHALDRITRITLITSDVATVSAVRVFTY